MFGNINDDAVDDNPYLFQEDSTLLLPLDHDDTDAGLDLKDDGSIPFSTLDNIEYEPYDESGPSSVHFNDLIDVSENGGSHLSSREDTDPTATSTNGDLTPIKNGIPAAYTWQDDSLQTNHGGSKTSPKALLYAKNISRSLNSSSLNSSRRLKPIARESPLSKPENQLDAFNGNKQSPATSPTNPAKRIKSSTTPEVTYNHDSYHDGTPNSRHSNKKPIVSELRPRSSIPSDIPQNEFAHQCIVAAYSSRLNPFTLHQGEYDLLQDHITQPQVTIYLNIRNAILRVWTRNPMVYVTKEEALGCARESRYFTMAEVAYHWLIRRGYINYGCLELPSSAGPISRAKATGKRRTIIVIGAGVSGLGCARQLQGLFLQYAYKFTEKGEKPPRVIVLEGRKRVGGRVYSHPLKDQKSKILPDYLRCTAEMGAQIVTGFESGNPLNAMIRGQLALHCHPLKDNTILYDHDGAPVDRAADLRVESLYNDILERASTYRNKAPVVKTFEGDKQLLYWAKDPSSEGTKFISELDGSEAAAAQTGANRQRKKNTTENVAGRGYVVGTGQKEVRPAAESAKALGYTLKPGVEESRSIDLDTFTKSRPHPTLGETMDEAIRQYQELVELSPRDLRLLNWHHANLEYANAVNVNQLSLGNWDQDIGNEFEGTHCEIIGGYTQFPRGLWQLPNPLDVQFGSTVKSIKYTQSDSSDDAQVTVRCTNGETYEGDVAVVTTSLGVLKHGSVQFEPALPDWKQGAIDRLGFGLLNKIHLVFDEPFWEQNRDMFGVLNGVDANDDEYDTTQYRGGRGRNYLIWDRTRQSGKPMLVALMAGDAAHEAEQRNDTELVDGVMAKLRSIFPSRQVPRPVETVVSRWKSDPFVRGSYSYVGSTSVAGDYDLMAKSVGSLYFAGEATCGTHPATVHGAFLSGLRAASDIIENLLGPIRVPNPLAPRKQRSDAPAVAPDIKEDLALLPDGRNGRARDEDYEASILGAILHEIGERPLRPGKAGTNPFLLYTKDYWHVCKAECNKHRQAATGNPAAKATKGEIRTALGLRWRNESEEIRQPYLDVTDNAKETSATNMAVYKEDVAVWDREAARIRKEYMEKNPMPLRTNGLINGGKLVMELGPNGKIGLR